MAKFITREMGVQISCSVDTQIPCRKGLYGKMRRRVGEILKDLCGQRGIEVIEGHAMPDHIRMCLGVPPKYSISNAMGFLKGKSAIRLHREIIKTPSRGKHFWVRGYCVSTVGLNEEQIREYIREQEKFDKNQMELEFN